MDDIIDLQEVLDRVQDDKELLLELLDIFQEDFVGKRQYLTEAVKNNDIQKIKELAHSLKGASGNISAKPMHANCLKIEQMARDNDISQIGLMLAELDRQFEELKINIAKLKQDFGQ